VSSHRGYPGILPTSTQRPCKIAQRRTLDPTASSDSAGEDRDELVLFCYENPGENTFIR